ncbi:MAG: hypothetical protein U1D55_05025 [Phycisphaerae bacterium]
MVLIRTAYDRDLWQSRQTALLLHELTGLRFTAERAYLPAFSATTTCGPALPRTEPLMHYLLFRDFGDIGRNPRLAQALRIPALAELSLFEPSFESDLLDIGEDDAGQWLERGYAYFALAGHGHPTARLLRFENFELPTPAARATDTHFSPLQAELYRAALDRDHPLRRQTREFTGEAILRELLQIPVAPRRFLR